MKKKKEKKKKKLIRDQERNSGKALLEGVRASNRFPCLLAKGG